MDSFSHQVDRSKITLMLLELFELWNLTGEEKLAALGLSTENKAAPIRYQKGEAITADRDMSDRAGNLLAIHKDLRLIFPSNPDLAYGWMKLKIKHYMAIRQLEPSLKWAFLDCCLFVDI